MRFGSGLAARVQRLFGERLGLRGSFGRLPERRTYELTPDEVARVQLAVREGNRTAFGPAIQFCANSAWCDIARARRLDARTIEPHPERGYPYFTAVPLPDDERDGGVFTLPVVGPK